MRSRFLGGVQTRFRSDCCPGQHVFCFQPDTHRYPHPDRPANSHCLTHSYRDRHAVGDAECNKDGNTD